MASSEESAIELAKAIETGCVSVVKRLVKDLDLDCYAVYEDPENVDRATFLHMAVMYRRSNVVKYLIEEKGVYVDQRLADGKTSLHIATIGGCFEIAKLLVKHEADCNAVDKKGCSPCFYAAVLGRAEIIEFLVKHGKADINKKTVQKGTSPFHIAAREMNDPSFLKLMIDLGADFSARDVNGHSALDYAEKNANMAAVKFLVVMKNFDLNQLNRPKGGKKLMHFLLDSEGETEAVAKGKAEFVEYLVKAGKANVNEVMDGGATPLLLACKYRDLNIVKLFVDAGANCKARDCKRNSPLHVSALAGKVDVVKYLIEKTDADVNACDAEGFTPLHFACKSGELDCLKLLLDNGADINSCSCVGYCCLHFAAIYGQADIVKYLVDEKKFDVNIDTGTKKCTSLHLAASSGHLELCKLLVELGADYALRDLEDNSALHYAAMEGHVHILEYFIKELGQDVNVCIDKHGASPLHLACRKDRLACVKFLLENGADCKLLDSEGMSCLGVAAKAPRLYVFRYLVERMIEIETC